MAPTVLQQSPMATVFFLPSLSPTVKAMMDPKKAPSFTIIISTYRQKHMIQNTYREAGRCDARDVGLFGLGKMLDKVARDQNAREDTL